MRIILIAVTLAVVPALVRPAAAQNREHVQMAAELRMLQEQQAELALAMAQLTQTLADAMKGLDARLNQSDEATKTGFANQAATLRAMGDDLRAIRANTQETSTRLGELREEISALRTTVTSLLSRSTAAPPPLDPLNPNASPDLAGGADVPVPLPPLTVGMSPERVIGTAAADYAAGQFSLAISGYENFIRNFPDSERADDAQQGIGDAEYAQMRFEEAIAAYNAVIQNYPKGDQVPWAYYKRGLVQRRLGRTDEARASQEMAIKTAPGVESNIAVLAKQQLDGLTREPAPAAPPGQ